MALTRIDLRGTLEPHAQKRERQLRELLPRPRAATAPPIEIVTRIIDEVREHGDGAIRRLTESLDGVTCADIVVPMREREDALRRVSPLLRESLEEARENIAAYARSTRVGDKEFERNGIRIRQVSRPVERVGCYIPGGRATYPSTVLMTALPARVAGVESIAIAVPPQADGVVPDAVLAAAQIAEVDEVYCMGGAQAIAALAYGTESVPRVDVICGPGNVYVATAKRLVSDVVGVPVSYAGPSEIVVIADETTNAEHAARDIMAQAEHGPDGMAWLVTWSLEAADRIDAEIDRLSGASTRLSEMHSTFAESGYSILVDDAQSAMDISNAVAPEHLELATVDPESLVPLVRHAGAIFAGPYSSAAIGDYLAGPSHVLPVYGSARFGSALGVRDFLREQHIIDIDERAFARISPHVVALAQAEGLDAHAEAILCRNRSVTPG